MAFRSLLCSGCYFQLSVPCRSGWTIILIWHLKMHYLKGFLVLPQLAPLFFIMLPICPALFFIIALSLILSAEWVLLSSPCLANSARNSGRNDIYSVYRAVSLITKYNLGFILSVMFDEYKRY